MTDTTGANESPKEDFGDIKEKTEKDDKKRNDYSLNLESVKSAAVVKYSAAEAPALYTRLQCNTNLNLPPSNWLSSSTETYGLLPPLLHRSGFSSFRIAHMFPDCIGQVDVISDAENIKKLLKIPYSRGSVSMMIHRIENTLLIDEFDIRKYLLREAESQWEWFKKFFSEHFMQPVSKKDILLHHKGNSRNTLQQKNLASKFLYHSLVVADANEKKRDEPRRIDPSLPIPLPYKSTNPSLPEPKLEEELPDPTSNQKFSRNVVWTFEDIQMLLGTDMPIFGGGTHPCISLRLRDMSKPINVLTGMDYWLDNLMCNVPEVVMCYHLNGIVQKYELIKTEDLPHLENSKFSPKVIRDIAQNILSFLKANATKAGHTYWLFKGKDDDVVKLYDLTSLCTDVMDEKGQTPFTVPVAMLLYRVARNMKNSPDGRRQAATIRMLLQNCISLLTPEKYAGIVTSAHYMIADLYIPADINPKSPELVGDEEEPQLRQESTVQNEFEDSKRGDISVKSLSLSNLSEIQIDEAEYIPPSPPPIGNDIQARCLDGIKHVVEGLHCLQFLNEMEGKEKQCADKREPDMAKPFETIPMPYESLNQTQSEGKKKKKKKKEQKSEESDKNALCKPKTDALASWESSSLKTYTWNIHLKTLLYQKAYLIYTTLSERAYVDGKFGLWLRYIRMVLKTRKVLKGLRPDLYCDGVENLVLGPAGDALFFVVQNSANLESHNADYQTTEQFDYELREELKSMGLESPDENEVLFPARLVDIEELLLCSSRCYRRALNSETDTSERSSLQRRLGNILNELGVFYMNQAAAEYQGLTKDDIEKCARFKELCAKSQNHLEEGIRAFESVKDEANLALLHSNTGRLMRLKAHFHAPSNDEDEEKWNELAGQERHFYNKAITSYQKALQVLGDRKYNPEIWDSVNWELSTALYSMASYLQDYPTCVKSPEEAEREVTEILHKALKYCDVETPGTRQPVYQFRSAMIHHRLASLYHKSFRTHCEDESRRKKILQLCKLHYEKSANLLLCLEHPAEYLRVQLERVALAEFQAEGVNNANCKIKHLENGLELLLEAKSIFRIMAEGEGKGSESEDSKDFGQEGKKLRPGKEDGEEGNELQNELNLLNFFEQRLQFILLSLTKLTIGKSDGKKESSHSGETYKKLYAMTLKKKVKDSNPVELAKWFYELVYEISKIIETNS